MKISIALSLLALAATVSAPALAEQPAQDPTKFAYHCEWKVGDVLKWEVHHINLPYKIADGKPATIDGTTVVFVDKGTERRIDLQSGVMEVRSLAQGAGVPQSEIHECKRMAALPS